MPDTFRIVTLVANRPSTVLDLNDQTGYVRDRDAGITFTPGPPTVQYSRRARRYGGARPVGVTHDNATLGWTAYVRGTTYAEVTQRVEALLQQIEDVATGKFIQWQPQGGLASYMEVAGPGTWTPAYDPVQFAQTFSMRVAITVPCLPLVRWDAMGITDAFDAGQGHIADYTFDAMTATDVTNVTAGLLGAGTLTTERRVRHASRGYTHFEGEATVTGQSPNTGTPTNFKLGVLLRASDASNYVECYVDDNGTNSRVRIDVVVAGVRTNRASVNLAARLTANSQIAVRGRIENNSSVFAEILSAGTVAPHVPGSTFSLTQTTYTLTSGEQTSLVKGYSGWSWIPIDATATIWYFVWAPFTRRTVTFPALFTFFPQSGSGITLPGHAPALMSATIVTRGGPLQPAWAQVAWSDYTDAVSNPPFGLYEAETFSGLTGWASSANATSSGGNDLRATTSGAASYSAYHFVDLTTVAADDFQASASGSIDLEIWVRAIVTSTVVNPRLMASFVVVNGGVVQAAGQRYTSEWGTVGKMLVLPSTGTVYRPVRLGTITVTKQLQAGSALKIDGTVDTGSTGAFGFDYAWVVPSRRRALGPTGVPLDSTYPQFVPNISGWVKAIAPDLSATIDVEGSALRTGDHGLSGSLMEVQPGTPKLLVKMSSEVPDDPTVDASTEQLNHTAHALFDFVPRSFLFREA